MIISKCKVGGTQTTAIKVNNGSVRLVISHSVFLNCKVHYWNSNDYHMIIISKSIFEGSDLRVHLVKTFSCIEISDNVFTLSGQELHADESAMVHIRNCLVRGSTQDTNGALYFKLISNPWLLLSIEYSVISNNIMTDAFGIGASMTVYILALEQDPIIIIRNVSFLNSESYGRMEKCIQPLLYSTVQTV